MSIQCRDIEFFSEWFKISFLRGCVHVEKSVWDINIFLLLIVEETLFPLVIAKSKQDFDSLGKWKILFLSNSEGNAVQPLPIHCTLRDTFHLAPLLLIQNLHSTSVSPGQPHGYVQDSLPWLHGRRKGFLQKKKNFSKAATKVRETHQQLFCVLL